MPPSSRQAGSHRRRRPVRRWPRRLLIAANILVGVTLVVSVAAFGYVRYRFDGIRTGSSKDLVPDALSTGKSAARDSAAGLSPENILIIGNETRAGQTGLNFNTGTDLTGTLSDIIMILHLDPKTRAASIISIPRDVFSPMPAGSPVGTWQKIDAALNDGASGPNNLAAAITQDYGIPINHYVDVDFDGFLQTVNALGGIKVDFPERLYDADSVLNIPQTGCQLLDGAEALALVRSRHLQYDPPGVSPSDPADWPQDPESDLARISIDHTFIRILADTAESKGLSNPLTANAFLSAVLNQIIIDPGLKSQLLQLASRYSNLDAANIPETTIPVTQVTGTGSGYVYDGYNVGDVEFPDEPLDLQTIQQWAPGVLPATEAPQAVEVFNDAGTYNLAATTGDALRADGFDVTGESDGQVPGSESETVVQYHPGQLPMGLDVMEKLSGAVILQSVATVPAGTVEVQAGSVLTVATPPAATAPSTTVAGAPTSVTVPATTTTTAPTPGGQAPSSSTDQLTPYDPRPC